MRTLSLILLLVLVGMQHRLWGESGAVPAVERLVTELQAQQRENTFLQARNRELEAEIEDLRDGFEVVEERARLELGMIRDGEVFYRIIGSGSAVPTPTQE